MMDTGKGRFVMLEDADQHPARKQALEQAYPEHGGWFHEGQVITIGGSVFKIRKVKPAEIVLRLVKRADQRKEIESAIERVRSAIDARTRTSGASE